MSIPKVNIEVVDNCGNVEHIFKWDGDLGDWMEIGGELCVLFANGNLPLTIKVVKA